MQTLSSHAEKALEDLYVFGLSCDNMGAMPKRGWKKAWSLKEIFEHFTERRGECLVWTGSVSAYGYGQIAHRGPKRGAHRVAYEMAHGQIPAGMFVCHSCDNPPCVEPSHLWLGTSGENTRDAVQKGRMAAGVRHWTRARSDLIPRGERRAFSKLTAEQVKEIKERVSGGRARGNAEKQSDIATEYGIAQTTVSKIKRGVKWSHV